MPITSALYGNVFNKAFNKEIDLDTDTVKVALLSNAYTPDQDAHDYWNDVSANELANGNGYTTGGATLASKVVSYTGGTNVFAFGAANVQWTSATFTARYATVYVDTTVSSTSPLIMYVNFGADQSVSSGTFTLEWNAAGLFTVTVGGEA